MTPSQSGSSASSSPSSLSSLSSPSSPRVVAIGGGHGLAATLRAARRYAGHVTAVVSVADDGGSSGRLRELLGLLPPGDLRRCLTALADDRTGASSASPWANALEHRFDSASGELGGHAVGNILIAGLAAVTGDFIGALDEVARVLAIDSRARVLPATLEPVVLKAEAHGATIEGQVAVTNTRDIRLVALSPPDATAPQPVLDALAHADQIVLGPGSLHTSVLAAALVPGIRASLAETAARKVYVCNLRPEVAETEDYDVADHVAALQRHGVDVDVVVCHPGALPVAGVPVPVIERPVARATATTGALVHDPDALAEVLATLV